MFLRQSYSDPHFLVKARFRKRINRLKFYFLFFASVFFLSTEIFANTSFNWIPSWQPVQAMNIARAGSAVVSDGNRIYVIGGVDGVNFLNSVESASVHSDGTLSPWSYTQAMPEARGFVSATIVNRRIYVIGGANGSYGKNLLRSIVSAPILRNGELGTWRTEKEPMLTPRRCAKIIVDGNIVHAIGGFNGALLSSVESTQIMLNGQMSKWSMQTNELKMPRYVNEVKKLGKLGFVFGGHHPTKGLGIKDVEYTQLNRTPLTWQKAPSMLIGRYAFSSAVKNDTLYALGGISGSEYLNSIEKLTIGDDLDAVTWQTSTLLPASMANFTTLIIGQSIYIIGGSTNLHYMNNVWKATFNNQNDIGYYGSEEALKKYKKQKASIAPTSDLKNIGSVLDVIQSASYTYIRVNQDGVIEWLAAPIVDVKVNQQISYGNGVLMSNFTSKSLNRQFQTIRFVGLVKPK